MGVKSLPLSAVVAGSTAAGDCATAPATAEGGCAADCLAQRLRLLDRRPSSKEMIVVMAIPAPTV